MLNLIKNNDGIFGDLFPTFGEDNLRHIKTDIKETKTGYLLEMELPGINKEDINVSIIDNILKVEVERSVEKSSEGEKLIQRERSYGKYSRSFRINNVDLENIEANFKDGLLTLIVNKSKEDLKKVIEVK